jgi:asparagine synthase (glutamine-hydrolysing)
MVAALRHRGPDDTGFVAFDDAVLGSSRLSIIDVAHGHQPLLGHDGSTALVCNGEIYGHRRIREATAGYPYRTGSDSEVVLALHERYGHDLLPHLPGTFSLALWDDRRRSLLLARDRFGERPLYWAQVGDLLVFASEVDALLASGLVEPELDRTVLAHVLRQGYVPPGTSIWTGVGSLRPASRLRWDASGGASVDRWWNPPPVGADPGREGRPSGSATPSTDRWPTSSRPTYPSEPSSPGGSTPPRWRCWPAVTAPAWTCSPSTCPAPRRWSTPEPSPIGTT